MKGIHLLAIVLAAGTVSPAAHSTEAARAGSFEAEDSPVSATKSGPGDASNPLEIAVAQLLANGLSDGSKANLSPTPRGPVNISLDDATSADYHPSHEVIVNMAFHLRWTDAMHVERMIELRNVFASSCTSHGGMLIPRGVRNRRLIQMAYETAAEGMLEAPAVGRFTCDANGTPLFHIAIEPFGSRKTRVGTIDGEKAARIAETHSARLQEASSARDALAPGSKVSVHIGNVPEDMKPDFILRDYYLCGLVLQVSSPLAQVQIGSKAIFMEISKLQPEWPQVSMRGNGPFTTGSGRCYAN